MTTDQRIFNLMLFCVGVSGLAIALIFGSVIAFFA